MMRWIHTCIAIIAMMAVSSCINEDIPQPIERVKVGQPLPDFSVVMNNGEIVTGAMLREGVSVIVFFHTSCPDCQQLLPQIEPLYDEYSALGVAFTLISRGEDKGSISAFWQSQNLTMPYSPQKNKEVYELFATSLIPRVYISDNQGIVQSIFTDNPIPSYDEIKAILEALL
ncbi:MAG: redoxin domain-containing protein [Alistipes sp.]|nr:redoxin domain-containing protein [Alistipes sp.]